MISQAKKYAEVFLIALSLTCFAACQQSTGEIERMQLKLVGWSISSINPAAVTITAKIAGGQISGSSGVNTYGGPCKFGPSDAFSAGPLTATEMAGPEPAMHAEAAYLKLLGEARFYSLADKKLTLYDQDENETLIFQAATP